MARAMSRAADGLLSAPFDPAWRSDCEVHSTSATTWWRPAPQVPQVDFSGIEHALETQLHPDIIAYYSTYWAGTLEAYSDEGPVSLIQLWNPEDFERLRANLIGHALAKHRRRLPLTIFFANTEPDAELFLSLDNQTGEVLLEEPSKPPQRVVEACLADFLARLKPTARRPDLY